MFQDHIIDRPIHVSNRLKDGNRSEFENFLNTSIRFNNIDSCDYGKLQLFIETHSNTLIDERLLNDDDLTPYRTKSKDTSNNVILAKIILSGLDLLYDPERGALGGRKSRRRRSKKSRKSRRR